MDCDLICVSQRPWDLVYQRARHLMSRAARRRKVLFLEEPVTGRCEEPTFRKRFDPSGVIRLIPVTPERMDPAEVERVHAMQLKEAAEELGLNSYALWACTATASGITAELDPVIVVYDCGDEPSSIFQASPQLLRREAELFRRSDLVFVGGHSLFRARRHLNRNTHCIPNSVDLEHFGKARLPMDEPDDQKPIPRPRVGCFGVIDQRTDLDLLRAVVALLPELQVIMLGPVVGIDPGTLPQAPNLHWLGARSYSQLPRYLSGWDAAILPFARNKATRFASPSRIPEYLAAGKPVVSTSIRDVVHPYGIQGVVSIADLPQTFAEALEDVIGQPRPGRLAAADRLLAHLSWDRTWESMEEKLVQTLQQIREAPLLALTTGFRNRKALSGLMLNGGSRYV